jgi:hypothetical protein
MNKFKKEVGLPNVNFLGSNFDIIFSPDAFDLKPKERICLYPDHTKSIPTGTILQIPSGYKMIIYPSMLLEKTPLILLPNKEIAVEGYDGEIILIVKNTLEKVSSNEFSAQGFQPNPLDVGRQYNLDAPGIKGVYEIKESDVIARAVLVKTTKYDPVRN